MGWFSHRHGGAVSLLCGMSLAFSGCLRLNRSPSTTATTTGTPPICGNYWLHTYLDGAMDLHSSIYDLDNQTYLTTQVATGASMGWDPAERRMLMYGVGDIIGWYDVDEANTTFTSPMNRTAVHPDFYHVAYPNDSRNIRDGHLVVSLSALGAGSAGPGESVIEYNLGTGALDFTLNWPLFSGNEGPASLGLITESGYRVYPSRCDNPNAPSTCAQDTFFRLLVYGDDYSLAFNLATGLNAAGGLELTEFTNGLTVKDLGNFMIAFSRGQRLAVGGGEFSDVFTATVNTGIRTNLTSGFLPGEFKHLVAVFPSEGKIAFATSVDGSASGGVSSLYLMNTDGTGKTLIDTLPYVGSYGSLGEPVGSKALIFLNEDGATSYTDGNFKILDAATGTLTTATGMVTGLADYSYSYHIQSMPCE